MAADTGGAGIRAGLPYPLRGVSLGTCAVLLGVHFACSTPPPALPAIEKLKEALGCSAPKAAPSGRPAVDVFLDASGSMRGFLQAPAAGYVRTLEDLLARLPAAGYSARVHALCDEECAQADAARDPRRIYTPAFYSGKETPLAQLLEKLALAPGRGGTTILISDLEQDAGRTDQRSLVDAFRKLADRTPELLLLSFQSEFQGPPSPSQPRRRGRAEREAAPQRRFYLLIVAPTAAALAELQKLVLQHLPAAHAFQPAQAPVVVKEVRQAPAGPDPAWGLYRKAQDLPCGAGTARLLPLLERRAPRDADGPVQLRVAGDFRLALHSAADLRYEVRAAGFPGANPGGRPAAGAQAMRPTAVLSGKDKDLLVLSVPAPRPARQSWDAYRVLVRPGGGNLEVPAWVREASGPLQRGQTPQLDHLVRAMQQAISENVVFLDLFLALGRGE